MNAAQLSQILLAPWRQRDLQAPWGRRVIVALLVLTLAGSLALLDGPVRWAIPAGVALVIVHGLWMAVGYNLLDQNHPTAARCVPGQLRALRTAALLGWAACTLLGSLAFTWLLPPRLGGPGVVLGNAVVAVLALWALRAWWLWVALAFSGPLVGALREPLAPLWQGALALWQAQPLTLLAGALLASAWAVTAIFGTGDARHRRIDARLRAMRAAQRAQLQGRSVTPAEALGGLGRISRPFEQLLSTWRSHLLARADNRRPGSVMARAALVLHGNQHWTYQLLGLAWLAAFLVIVLGLVLLFSPASGTEMLSYGGFGISFGLGTALVQPVMARTQALWHSRREQALLRLLPHMPQGAAQNRALAAVALRHALAVGLALAALLLPLGVASGQTLMLWMPVVSLPWLVWAAMRPLARLRPPSAWTSAVPMFCWFMTAVIAQLIGDLLHLPVPVLAAPLLLAAAAWGVWRWRQMGAEPPALPVGRGG